MENSVQALLIAFAVLIFVVALTLSFTTLSQAKSTADVVLFYSDREKFQKYVKADPDEQYDGGRTVSTDTVLATLARSLKENFAVTIIEDSSVEVFDYAIDNRVDLERNIKTFIKNHIGSNNKYRETYQEVVLGGTVHEADGIKLEEDVGKKIYLIFKKI